MMYPPLQSDLYLGYFVRQVNSVRPAASIAASVIINVDVRLRANVQVHISKEHIMVFTPKYSIVHGTSIF